MPTESEPGIVLPPEEAPWAKLSIAPGRNTWRLCLTNEIPTREKALTMAGRATVRLLSTYQPLAMFWPYPSIGAYALASGEAVPINPIEVKRGPPSAAMGLPMGEVLGMRSTFLPAPPGAEPVPVSLGMPRGGYPCWWAFVDFWWRGDPIVDAKWPLIGSGAEQFAVLDLAVKPTVENDPGTMTPEEIARDWAGKWFEQTATDWDKLGRRAGGGAGLLLTGGVLAILAVALLRRS